jgi:hypothetical protein
METRKKVLGAEYPDTLISMNNLAFTFKFQDRNGRLANKQTAVCLFPSFVYLYQTNN